MDYSLNFVVLSFLSKCLGACENLPDEQTRDRSCARREGPEEMQEYYKKSLRRLRCLGFETTQLFILMMILSKDLWPFTVHLCILHWNKRQLYPIFKYDFPGIIRHAFGKGTHSSPQPKILLLLSTKVLLLFSEHVLFFCSTHK